MKELSLLKNTRILPDNHCRCPERSPRIRKEGRKGLGILNIA
jgi:hypothetical protein